MTVTVFTRIVLGGTAGLMLLSVRASAQDARLSGVVTDTSYRVISGATVRLVNSRDELLGTTRTDTAGAYSATVAPGDTIRIFIRRIGYTPHESKALVVAGVSLRYNASLVPMVQRLSEVVVRGGETNRQAFLDRAAAGTPHAYFADSAQLASKDHRSVFGLFDQLSGMGIRLALPRRFTHTSGRSPARASVGTAPGGRDEVLVGPSGCEAILYLDGEPTTTPELLRSVRAREVMGVEVYNSGKLTPIPYRPVDFDPCMVILVWSHDGLDWPARKW